jgi:hypothetical protein
VWADVRPGPAASPHPRPPGLAAPARGVEDVRGRPSGAAPRWRTRRCARRARRSVAPAEQYAWDERGLPDPPDRRGSCRQVRELRHPLAQVRLGDDRVAPVDALCFVPGELHRHRAGHPGPLRVAHGRAAQVVDDAPDEVRADHDAVSARSPSSRPLDDQQNSRAACALPRTTIHNARCSLRGEETRIAAPKLAPTRTIRR